ncbi:M20 family metallopeptidase [Bradyrhizobium sp. UNPF46]|uniref:M20 family metallopeptidase n=1 Tax=Bradyrhizobium sp. UNPF46 TaxID=1141168 RepID=UPI001FEF4770|nr:M20 family metallopeptidase [Bradyrhizobium sp. UNPF46]
MRMTLTNRTIGGAERERPSREAAIAAAEAALEDGTLFEELSRAIACRTESQRADSRSGLVAYLTELVVPYLEALGFACHIIEHREAKGPFLVARRQEHESLPTIMCYGHGDVVEGLGGWRQDLTPWKLTAGEGRWYGRGVADNKGQHYLNMAAMRAVLETRGYLGFNSVFLIETGEEVGSPGLRQVCAENRDLLRSDILIASDGPRISADRPTIYLGARGAISFKLCIDARSGTYHSGNWGGLLSNPALQLAHGLSSIASATGQIRIPEWLPPEIPVAVRAALRDCVVSDDEQGPKIDHGWGEPGLSAAEKVYGWTSFEVLAFEAGRPGSPMNAVPASAFAVCQLRFVVGVDEDRILPALREHLDRCGLGKIQVSQTDDEVFHATRLDPDDPWVGWARGSLERSIGKSVVVLPNVGASLPNDIFSELLNMRTIWIPHSYPAAANHGVNEHVPISVVREGLRGMAGLYWDLGEGTGLPPTRNDRRI